MRWTPALVLFVLLWAGCREETPSGGDGDNAFVVRMTAGTRMLFDHWLLDRTGSRIAESRTTRTWFVAAEGVRAYGFEDAVLVLDTVAGGRTDSLYFRFSPPGDVYAYGYLSRMVRRRLAAEIPPGWDRIAAFSLPAPVTWPVGFVDSAQTARAVGETTGEIVFFEVYVNGVRTALPARQADLSANTLLATAWFSTAPSAAVRLREDVLLTPQQVAGELSELVSVAAPP